MINYKLILNKTYSYIQSILRFDVELKKDTL